MNSDALPALRASLDHLHTLVKAERGRRAGLRLDFAFARFARRYRKYAPGQPRNDRGQFAETGAGDDVDVTGSIVVQQGRTGDPTIDSVTEILERKAGEALDEVGEGFGPFHGIQVHSAFARAVKLLIFPG